MSAEKKEKTVHVSIFLQHKQQVKSKRETKKKSPLEHCSRRHRTKGGSLTKGSNSLEMVLILLRESVQIVEQGQYRRMKTFPEFSN